MNDRTAPMGDSALSTIRGGVDAQHLLQRIRSSVAPADALLVDMLEVQAVGDADRFRGFCREIGKALERMPQ